MYPETSGAMTRSFSLAPGGWVGTKPGRAGETKEQDSASESKFRPLIHTSDSSDYSIHRLPCVVDSLW